MNHLDSLKMKIRRYPNSFIYEFDSIDELRLFDKSYIHNTRSAILKDLASRLKGSESEITQIEPVKNGNTTVAGIRFVFRLQHYSYTYEDKTLRSI
jgi:hypothetical protein